VRVHVDRVQLTRVSLRRRNGPTENVVPLADGRCAQSRRGCRRNDHSAENGRRGGRGTGRAGKLKFRLEMGVLKIRKNEVTKVL
jgi:hypothetical protein